MRRWNQVMAEMGADMVKVGVSTGVGGGARWGGTWSRWGCLQGGGRRDGDDMVKVGAIFLQLAFVDGGGHAPLMVMSMTNGDGHAPQSFRVPTSYPAAFSCSRYCC